MRQFLPVFAAVLLWFPQRSEASSLSFEFPLDLQYQELAIEPSGSVSISDEISVTITAVYESSNAGVLTTDEILLRHDGDRLSLWGGKFAPEFGQAWDQEQLPISVHASEYEGASQMGIGASVLLGAVSGIQMRTAGAVFEESERSAYIVSAELTFPSGVTVLGANLKTAEREGNLVSVRAELPVGRASLEPLLELAQLRDKQILSAGIGMESDGLYYSLQHSTRLTAGRADSVIQASLRWSR